MKGFPMKAKPKNTAVNYMRKTMKFLMVLLLGGFLGCSKGDENKKLQNKGFKNIKSEKSGIAFSNDIITSDTFNYNTFPYIYLGGGVALGDINNDGLTDIYLTGNMVPNKLYLNLGNLQFKDISVNASVAGDSRWYTGVTMVDINSDGWLDIYVSVSGLGDNTQNQLFVNNGDLTFTERAAEFGIADPGNSIQSTFFDYDNDGDLDAYVANYPIIPLTMPNYFYHDKMEAKDIEESGHLFRNEGNGTFKDVTIESGVLNFGLSLGIAVSDFNNDGWQDLYVSNDFNVPDYFYLNNADGTFSEKLQKSTRQISMFGMGVDAADFNNDGLMDLFQVDMTPADHYRSKTNMASMDPSSFYSGVALGFHYQYMQNSFQVNNGINNEGVPIFSNVARLSGVATTDWSWAPLFADFDNDGLKDIMITNGMRLDVNNNDLLSRENNTSIIPEKIDMNKAPSTPIANYLFKNMGNYEFENVSENWNIDFKGFSNGLAYGDLDNDGDLDMVINNIDDKASLLENNNTGSNYIRVALKGDTENPLGIGTKVKVTIDGTVQWLEQHLSRGFQSSIEPILHFGLGTSENIDELKVIWPDGSTETLSNIAADQTLKLLYENANKTDVPQKPKKAFFKDITSATQLKFRHIEDAYNDYFIEPLLPHRNSRLGPALSVKDINNDGLDDIFIGNATGSQGKLFVQNDEGTFTELSGPWTDDSSYEDTGATFFDADNDGDQDLYVVSGGNNYGVDEKFYQDRLYMNTPEGFIRNKTALPEIVSSGQKVIPADYDGDGDLDLFVGGRIVPGHYLQPPKSYLLRNNGGTDDAISFDDITLEKAPELRNIGMVTSALWHDFNMDGYIDLILAGEWMPLTFFENKNSALTNVTEKLHLSETVGWWNSLAVKDLDNDGDMDIVAGNLGLNSKYKSTKKSPFEIYVNDFDGNNRPDIVLSVTKKGVKLPLRGRECSSQQIPSIKGKFESFDAFASANLNEIYGEQKLKDATHFAIDTFAHQWLENTGNGTYQMHELPVESQLSSINDIVFFDYNNDSFTDILIAGNLYDTEVETPRSDAGIGLVLQNMLGKGFKAISMSESGLLLNYQVKNIAPIKLSPKGTKGFVIATNNDSLRIISQKPYDNAFKNGS